MQSSLPIPELNPHYRIILTQMQNIRNSFHHIHQTEYSATEMHKICVIM